MAIAIDTDTGSGAWNNSESSVTWSHTVSTAEDPILFVWVNSYANRTTGVTYNGTAMTFVAKQWYNISQRYVSCYVLHAPATGANNIVWSLSSNDYCRSSAISLTGAEQTGQPSDYNNDRFNTTSLTKTFTLTTTSFILIGFDPNAAWTAGTDTTQVRTGDASIGRSTTSRGSGSQSIVINDLATSYDYPQISVVVQEAGGSTFTPKVMMY